MSERRTPYVPNPVLGGLLGICPLVAAATSLVNGFILGAGAALCVAILVMALPLIQGFVPDRLRAPASLGLSAALALLVGFAIEVVSPATARGLGVYLPLLAVNCISLHTLRRAPVLGGQTGSETARSFGNAALLLEALGYLGAATLVGGIRELLGAGTLSLPLPGAPSLVLYLSDSSPAPLFSAPAGGFILLGALAALYRALGRFRGRKKT